LTALHASNSSDELPRRRNKSRLQAVKNIRRGSTNSQAVSSLNFYTCGTFTDISHVPIGFVEALAAILAFPVQHVFASTHFIALKQKPDSFAKFTGFFDGNRGVFPTFWASNRRVHNACRLHRPLLSTYFALDRNACAAASNFVWAYETYGTSRELFLNGYSVDPSLLGVTQAQAALLHLLYRSELGSMAVMTKKICLISECKSLLHERRT
jgi:hypothetical protein